MDLFTMSYALECIICNILEDEKRRNPNREIKQFEGHVIHRNFYEKSKRIVFYIVYNYIVQIYK